MLCRKPFGLGTAQAFPCGQCMPCRINRRRLWTHRILLEQRQHGESCFVTLTYNQENIPADGSLNPRDLTLFLKRLRKQFEPLELRYFAVGEYGDQTFRPHYHLAIFGLGMQHTRHIEAAWSLDGESLGHVLVGDLTQQSAAYVAGYVTKKMTSKDDPRLCGKHPEFARMSLRPGIGAPAVPAIGHALNSATGAALVARDGDVPVHLGHGRTTLPLGRYLRRKLRSEMGFDQEGGQETAARKQAAELRALSEAVGTAQALKESGKALEPARSRRAEVRARLFNSKGKL